MGLGRPRFTPRRPGQPSVGRRRAVEAVGPLAAEVPDGLSSAADVAELLGSLTGREVSVGQGPVVSFDEPVVIAVFVDEDGQPVSAILADIDGSASMAAALTLLPAGVVEEAKRRGTLDAALLENWTEIANILTQIVRVPGFQSGTLQDCVHGADVATGAVKTFLERARFRAGWRFEVPGYGAGHLAVYLAAPGGE